MTSLEDETLVALARRFSLHTKKMLTIASREGPQSRGVLGANWARGKSLFDFGLKPNGEPQLQSNGRTLVERHYDAIRRWRLTESRWQVTALLYFRAVLHKMR
jgi:hypothetical protein